ncbi:23S rRNA methylase [Cenarchaeum symbiosum A]|uniref:Ribosomal RNA large subunit methyltransferase E n=1 Tax=Cenarchaeum symbiosum (strain A) TaxID=414004 RepID=RLME_CENSY|nr:RecName: Full=Ribosomal RNA large subunit methyltransferase E; AltName: Full=23S rRNA Um2552 methyltransferase; AltName: Full=rRNA (uridine-2'-O-)-methyltransferase [Cenarchaeum symbiosum A]ABK77195.1 23S rRNA methylase [Cenarchaeum symbiosum A]
MRPLDAKKDHYRKMAREQGYRSRAAYKLKELNKAYRIIGAGFTVLDLGCAPGSWMQVAASAAGNRGTVLGVDLEYAEELNHAESMRGDVEDESLAETVAERLGRADAVICDLSPQVSGNWSVDHARQISLNYAAARIMGRVLAPKGNAVFKVFDGEYAAEFREHMGHMFSKTKSTKPQASRKQSSELYLVCLGFRG